MSAPAAMLVASDLALRSAGHVLFEDISLELHAGETLGIIGPNGAGKSSLLKVLAGLQQPSAGSLTLDGRPVVALDPSSRARSLAYLEQRPQVQWPLAVQQVVALGRLPFGDARSATAQQTIAAAMAATATDELRERNFHTLSEGEKVRVHLARVLAGMPRLVLADEPIAALDPWYQLQVLELLRAQAARGTAIAVVLHDLQLAARFCDRLLVLERGRVRAQGKPCDVLNPALLAQVWRIEASFDSATLGLTIHGRLIPAPAGAR